MGNKIVISWWENKPKINMWDTDEKTGIHISESKCLFGIVWRFILNVDELMDWNINQFFFIESTNEMGRDFD